jgi:hypothetical protein
MEVFSIMPAGLLQPFIPDVSDWLKSANQGYALGDTIRNRDLSVQAGQQAASGNMLGARSTLYGGGNFEAARGIDTHQQSMAAATRAASNDQLARALKVQGALADVAHAITTPEEFEAAKGTLAKAGLPGVDKYNFADLPTLRAQALDIKTKLEMALKERALENKNPLTGELEKGERWRMSDGKLAVDTTGRPIAEPIPGGTKEAVTAETAARIGLGEAFVKKVPELESKIKKGKLGTSFGYRSDLGADLDFNLGRGEAGEIYREMQQGADALLRNLTGAGMNMQEAQDYANRYLPGRLDSRATTLTKLQGLKDALQAAQNRVLIGRGRAGVDTTPGAPAVPPKDMGGAGAGAGTVTRFRFNPKTGELE